MNRKMEPSTIVALSRYEQTKKQQELGLNVQKTIVKTTIR